MRRRLRRTPPLRRNSGPVRRLLLKDPPDDSGRIRFTGGDYRYLARVLRVAPGATLRVLLPDGTEALAEILGVDGKTVSAAVVSADSESDSGPGSVSVGAEDARRRGVLPCLPPMVLIQALPKSLKMDDLVRQATELGVSLILPFVADRSVSRPEGGQAAASKRERWLRIVREARQQSGSDTATDVSEPLSLADALAAWAEFSAAAGGGAGIFLHQDPLAQGTIHSYLNGDPKSIALAVGPEGGFSDRETSAFAAAGFHPALLGANVLRVETAAVSALAAVQVILLEKSSWMPKTPDSPE